MGVGLPFERTCFWSLNILTFGILTFCPPCFLVFDALVLLPVGFAAFDGAGIAEMPCGSLKQS